MAAKPRRNWAPIPKAGSPPPPPRPAEPITQSEVVRWARRIEAVARRSRTAPDPDFPREFLFTLEQSIRRLLDPVFRAEFSEALFGGQQLATRGFFASDPARGRPLLQKWGLIEVIPPRWDGQRRRYLRLAPFHVPIFHWPGRGGSSELSLRLLLDRHPMTWHPQYLLRCRLCGWSQGALGSVWTFHSTITLPRQQLEQFTSARSGRRGESRRPCTIYRDIARSFAEEVWGFESANFAMDRNQRAQRQPRSGKIADLLDEAMGYRVTLALRPEIDPHKMFPRSVRPRLRVLRLLLRELRCQVCDRTDTLRFVPRVLFPIDIDATENSQIDLVGEIVRDLLAKREALQSDAIARGVFLIPGMIPFLRPMQIADRIASLCDDAGATLPAVRVDPRLAAMWTIARMKDERSWRSLETDLLDCSTLPVEEDDLANNQIGPLRDAVLTASAGKRPGQAAGLVWDLLHTERYRCAGELIMKHYKEKVIPRTPTKRRSKRRSLK